MANRRSFVAGMLAAGLLPGSTWADAGCPAFLSAGMAPDGSHVLAGLTADGRIAFELPLPARGHAAAAHPTLPEAVAFARRPGTYAIVLDCSTGRQLARLEAPSGHHFYGHGAFSTDGAQLFTTENDYDAARGMVGVWDARKGYRRLGAFPSAGVGPHDIKLMPNGETLVVANGGIETHPETGRAKLNIPSMRPNLSYLDRDGQVLEQVELTPEYRKNSIRHLALSASGTVAFAMQWQGDVVDHPALLGVHRRGGAVRLSRSNKETRRSMVGYAGSVAISDDLGAVAVTSPRGGVMQLFDLETGLFSVQIALEDVCGVAANKDGFCATNGLGQVVMNASGVAARSVQHPRRWDNHLVAVAPSV